MQVWRSVVGGQVVGQTYHLGPGTILPFVGMQKESGEGSLNRRRRRVEGLRFGGREHGREIHYGLDGMEMGLCEAEPWLVWYCDIPIGKGRARRGMGTALLFKCGVVHPVLCMREGLLGRPAERSTRGGVFVARAWRPWERAELRVGPRLAGAAARRANVLACCACRAFAFAWRPRGRAKRAVARVPVWVCAAVWPWPRGPAGPVVLQRD
jgi:hypothetical protein